MRLPDLVRRRRYAILLAGIVLLGLFLRLYKIGANSFWWDETSSVWMSGSSLADTLNLVVRDVHPPLYFLLLHFWLHLTSSDAGIRLFSAICGVLNIPVMYLLGRRIAGRVVGLLAALILAVAPFHVMYAQEARMYTLLALLVSLSLYFLARLLSDPRAAEAPLGSGLVDWWHSARVAVARVSPTRGVGSPASSAADQLPEARASLGAKPSTGAVPGTDLSWLGLVFSTGAALLTHNTAVFLPLGANYYVLGRYLLHRITTRTTAADTGDDDARSPAAVLSQRFIHNWLTAQLGVLLIFTPWLPSFVAQSMRVDRTYWIYPPTPGATYQLWWELSSAWAPQSSPYVFLIPLLFLGLVTLGLLYFRRQPHWTAFLVLIGLTPFVGELLVSIRRPIFLDRTLIWVSIPYYLLLAAGLKQLRCRPLVLAALSMLVTINGFSLANYYSNSQKQQWREAAAYVCERAGDEDLVVVCGADNPELAFDYYRRRYPHRFDQEGMKVTADSLATLPKLTAGRSRTWFVCFNYPNCRQALSDVLSEDWRLASDQEFFSLRVLEFVPK